MELRCQSGLSFTTKASARKSCRICIFSSTYIVISTSIRFILSDYMYDPFSFQSQVKVYGYIVINVCIQLLTKTNSKSDIVAPSNGRFIINTTPLSSSIVFPCCWYSQVGVNYTRHVSAQLCFTNHTSFNIIVILVLFINIPSKKYPITLQKN